MLVNSMNNTGIVLNYTGILLIIDSIFAFNIQEANDNRGQSPAPLDQGSNVSLSLTFELSPFVLCLISSHHIVPYR